MKKKIFMGVAGFAALAAAVCVTVSSVAADANASDLMTKNIEALTGYELGNLDQACRDYCRNYSGYVCVLSTSAGFNIYCDEMVSWNF